MMNYPEFMFRGTSEPVFPKINGVMVAVVTDNKDPDGLARVKLKLPLREAETETDWVRMATLMAGKDRGSLFIPEVGDEVLVAFHLGEIRQPFVIGTLWSTKQPSPKGNDKNDLRKFKSRAGHELEFDDNDSDGKVTIKTKKGQTIVFSDKQDIIDIKEQSGNNSIQIKGGSANEITIKSSSSTIMLNAKGDVSIESTKEIKIKSTQVNIEASATMALKAGASLDLKSDGIINIKGSMVKIN
ncbi:phage baseplate assembly protein V [Paenibacillus radicis (ex Xue et al. 2023)]|uniref:Phage baseplate assembly protein V n=1 Tax=Paenibacillus radicis (ex Xue et al. 2023) TaxID=2972489 RepID=A0ABT1YKS2_9BACL|nr:phage baseplate assembly protein V [Paenibacillus radicis (ex Xue et al. 2023)]MCR8633776.1 phage baseplate assembly protein V [Paenibacillus radicis (ex Xue et al. 2023)]